MAREAEGELMMFSKHRSKNRSSTMGLSRNPKLCDTLNSPRQNYTETSRGDVKKT